MFPSNTVGLPGSHGPTVAGIQGIGVSTPSAAAVAAATIGFAIDIQAPKGRILSRGLLSMMFAAGIGVKVLFMGSTTSEEGAIPKLHFRVAPIQT